MIKYDQMTKMKKAQLIMELEDAQNEIKSWKDTAKDRADDAITIAQELTACQHALGRAEDIIGSIKDLVGYDDFTPDMRLSIIDSLVSGLDLVGWVNRVASTKYQVILESHGNDIEHCRGKLACIKVVREINHMGLKETKELVESTPRVVVSGVTMDEAKSIRAKLLEVGATATIKKV